MVNKRQQELIVNKQKATTVEAHPPCTQITRKPRIISIAGYANLSQTKSRRPRSCYRG